MCWLSCHRTGPVLRRAPGEPASEDRLGLCCFSVNDLLLDALREVVDEHCLVQFRPAFIACLSSILRLSLRTKFKHFMPVGARGLNFFGPRGGSSFLVFLHHYGFGVRAGSVLAHHFLVRQELTLRSFSVSSLGAPVAPPASCLGVPLLRSLFSGLCFASTGRRRPYRPPVLLRSTSPLHGLHIEVNFFVGSLFGSFTVTRFRGAGFPVQSIQVCWSGSFEVLIERDDCFRGR